MKNFKKLVAFIEMRAAEFPFPEWAIFCEARDLEIVGELEEALMAAENRHEFCYSKIASYFNNHSHT